MDLEMENWMELLSVLIPVLGVLGGAYIGGHYTNRTQKVTLLTEEELNRKKQRNNQMLETLKTYNSVLKIDGEHLLVMHVGGGNNEFDIEFYQEYIRSSLYGKFHMIHDDVAITVREIDNMIAECSYNEEINRDEYNVICSLYFQLINQIETHLNNFRKL